MMLRSLGAVLLLAASAALAQAADVAGWDKTRWA